jgi:hypothetical protein
MKNFSVIGSVAFVLALQLFAQTATAETPHYVEAKGDYHSSWAQGSLRDFVVKKARKNALIDAVSQCREAGYQARPLVQDDEVLVTGLENGQFWATVDVTYQCNSPQNSGATAIGEGEGTAIISVLSAKRLAKAKAFKDAKLSCESRGYDGTPSLQRVLDDHASCIGRNCSAWFSGLYNCN